VRIALNAQLLSFEQSYRSGGINRVIYYLLAELGRDPRGHQFDVFAPQAPTSNGFTSLRFHPTGAATARPPSRILWEQTILPRELNRLRPDLLHGMAYALPVAWSGPAVVSIYDLSFLRFREAFKPMNRVYLAASARAAARRARQVLTISEHSRRDIVRLLGVPEDKIDVVPWGLGARPRVEAAPAAATAR
jgi:glycosyltransferase involved in cell wall biosynthesis